MRYDRIMKPVARVLFILICSLGLCLCLSPSAAIAQSAVTPQQMARQLFDDGVAMAKRGEHHQAADAFAQAWDLDRRPEYMRERAIALRNAGQSVGAVDSFKKYLIAAPADAPDRAEMQAALVEEQSKIEPARRLVDPRLDPQVVATPASKEGPAPAKEGREGRPFYKSWWFWTAAGVVAAASVGAGVGAWAAQNRADADPYLRVSWR